MGPQQARAVASRRPRWRSYLVLSRASNLPTVWTNVLASLVVSGSGLQSLYLALGVAVTLLYTAGMFLNDAFDRTFDSRARPERPIPSGDVGSAEVFITGSAAMVVGVALLAWIRTATLPWALALSLAILYYDVRHKRDGMGPVVMGMCRALIYPLTAAAAAGVDGVVLVAACVMWVYVTCLTLVSKRLGQRARNVTPRLLAGICIVDALIMLPAAIFGSGGWPVLIAFGGFFLTRAAQRFVPAD